MTNKNKSDYMNLFLLLTLFKIFDLIDIFLESKFKKNQHKD